MIRLKATTLLIHVASWMLFLTFPLLFMRQQEGQSILSLLVDPYYWQFGLCYIFLFYLNSLFLFPRLFLQKKYVSYAFVVLLLLTGIGILQPFGDLLKQDREQPFGEMRPPRQEMIAPPPTPPFRQPLPDRANSSNHGPNRPPEDSGLIPRTIDITALFIFIIIMALSTATTTMQQWRVTEKRVVQAEADKAHAELSFLKAQINPHFLFNTLNNIYSLAITQNENTAVAILKLSNIMRYVTDEVQENVVPLQNEVDCIRDYIDLQRLRLNKSTDVDFSVAGNLTHQFIAPLMLMTFVENIFKYGISNRLPSVITIRVVVEPASIRFFCQNQIFTTPPPTERAGVGLVNTRQRLAHLYPNKHALTIEQENHLFTVQLTLQT